MIAIVLCLLYINSFISLVFLLSLIIFCFFAGIFFSCIYRSATTKYTTSRNTTVV